jgi:hypothetical protein
LTNSPPTLPSSEYQRFAAFGSGLFSPIWQSRQNQKDPHSPSGVGTATDEPDLERTNDTLVSISIKDDTAVSGTLAYLGLQDPDTGPTGHQIPLECGVPRTLWVGNVDPSVQEQEILRVFSEFGSIESIRLLPEKDCAFINYCHASGAAEAKKKMQGGRLGNCVIKVGFGKVSNIHSLFLIMMKFYYRTLFVIVD